MSTKNHASDGGLPALDAAAAGQREAATAAAIDSLRAARAQQIDPVGLRRVEALARRAAAHAGAVRPILDLKLAKAIAACRARCEQACAAHGQHGLAPRFDAKARIDRGPLAALVDELDRPAATGNGLANAAAAATSATPGGELRALRNARQAWTRLSVDRQLSRSIAKRPDNPGPLNSHLLVLRALQTMQNISPVYLQNFLSHAETLWWLDQATFGITSNPAKVRRDGENKRPTRRGRPR